MEESERALSAAPNGLRNAVLSDEALTLVADALTRACGVDLKPRDVVVHLHFGWDILFRVFYNYPAHLVDVVRCTKAGSRDPSWSAEDGHQFLNALQKIAPDVGSTWYTGTFLGVDLCRETDVELALASGGAELASKELKDEHGVFIAPEDLKVWFVYEHFSLAVVTFTTPGFNHHSYETGVKTKYHDGFNDSAAVAVYAKLFPDIEMFWSNRMMVKLLGKSRITLANTQPRNRAPHATHVAKLENYDAIVHAREYCNAAREDVD